MPTNSNYKKIRIPKRNGKYRIIYIPDEQLKAALQATKLKLLDIYNNTKQEDFDHAFVKGRNCVSHARLHIKHNYVLKIDIKDAFDSITHFHLEKYVAEDVLNQTLINGQVPQGFPTSPLLFNIAMIAVDNKIKEHLSMLPCDVVYSRYADDLTFSFDDATIAKNIINEISMIFRFFKLKINAKKTKLQNKQNGRAIITGIGVSDYAVHPTRKTIKKIRAAEHQNNEHSHKGLLEWSLCKPPQPERKLTDTQLLYVMKAKSKKQKDSSKKS